MERHSRVTRCIYQPEIDIWVSMPHGNSCWIHQTAHVLGSMRMWCNKSEHQELAEMWIIELIWFPNMITSVLTTSWTYFQWDGLIQLETEWDNQEAACIRKSLFFLFVLSPNIRNITACLFGRVRHASNASFLQQVYPMMTWTTTPWPIAMQKSLLLPLNADLSSLKGITWEENWLDWTSLTSAYELTLAVWLV